MPPADNDVPQMQREDKSILRVGQTLDGRFEIVSYLGCGGMGSVYQARQVEMGRKVALKIMHPRYTADVAAVKRFQREAQIISSLQHTNILSVYQFGGVDGLLYLAMEFVQGNSLGQLIAQKGRMPSEQAIPLLLEICNAMSYAHRNDVLHRDLKPDNVMVVKSCNEHLTAKVVDFGLAKLLDSVPGQRLTRTGEVVGDPRYMSPQQCKGEKLDARDDVYSFGCLMYELLTGELPFDADDPVAIMHKQIAEAPKPFAKRIGLPRALEAITLIAMAKEKSDRYESFDDVSEVLTKFCDTPDLNIPLPVSRRKAKFAHSSKRYLATAFCASVVLAAAGLLYASGTFDWSILQVKAKYSFTSNSVEKFQATTALADNYARRGDFKEAERLYKEAVALAASSGDRESMVGAQSGLGGVYRAAQRNSEASQAYRIALSEAMEQTRRRKPSQQLIDVCKRTLVEYGKIEPVDAVQTASSFATICETIKSPKDGEQILISVGAIGPLPLRFNNRLTLARLNLRQSDLNDAQKYFDQAIELSPSAPARAECSKVAAAESLAAGEYTTAAHFIKQQLSLTRKDDGSEDPKLKFELANCLFRSKNFGPARIAYEDASVQSKRDKDVALAAKSLAGAGQSCLMMQDFTKAEQEFRQELSLLNQLPTSTVSNEIVDARCALAILLTAQRRFDEAKVELQSANDVLSNSARDSAAEIRRQKVRSLSRALKWQVQDALAQASMQSHNYAIAEQIYRSQIRSFTGDPAQLAQTHWSLADALTRSGRLDESLKELRNGLALLQNADNSQLATGLKALIMNEILLVTAIQANERARKENVDKNHIKAEQISRENIARIQKIRESNASVRLHLHLALYELGESLYEQQRFDESEQVFMKAIASMEASADKTSELRTKVSSSLSATRTARKLLRRRSLKE